jgi:DNA-binding transcriptional ArsR family regulator
MTRKHIDHKFSALSDPTRRQILEFLSDGDAMRVGELAAMFNTSRQAVTKHLDILCNAELVATQWQGRERISSIRPDAFEVIWDWLNHYDRFWAGKLKDLKELIERREES